MLELRGNIDLKSLEIADLERVVTEYPWYGYARKVLFDKLADSGTEHLETHLKKCSLFLPSLKEIYYAVQKKRCAKHSSIINFDEINGDFDDVVFFGSGESDQSITGVGQKGAEEKVQTKYVVLGGDYFTRQDFEELDRLEPLKLGRIGVAGDEPETDIFDNESVVNKAHLDEPNDFCTETLARIYAEQGYYEEAMKVYAKLILLYPEKNTYFANLVNKLKEKNN